VNSDTLRQSVGAIEVEGGSDGTADGIELLDGTKLIDGEWLTDGA